MKIRVINGPNLNLIGIREKGVYGTQSYSDLKALIESYGKEKDIHIEVLQTNHEGAIIDYIHDAYFKGYDGIIINPGAYTHYSYAIHDALSSVEPLLKVEVHLSNIYQREEFRQVNVIKDTVDYSVIGKGFQGYIEAIDYLCHKKS